MIQRPEVIMDFISVFMSHGSNNSSFLLGFVLVIFNCCSSVFSSPGWRPENRPSLLGITEGLVLTEVFRDAPARAESQEKVTQGLIQVALEYLQSRTLHALPGKTVPVLPHPQSKEVSPHIQIEFPNDFVQCPLNHKRSLAPSSWKLPQSYLCALLRCPLNPLSLRLKRSSSLTLSL